MDYIVIGIIGFIGGAFAGHLFLEWKRNLLEDQRRDLESKAQKLKIDEESSQIRRQELNNLAAHLSAQTEDFDEKVLLSRTEEQSRVRATWVDIRAAESRLKNEIEAFESRNVTLQDLESENITLKRDLRNYYVEMRKLRLDRDEQKQVQFIHEQKISEVGGRYLKDTVNWIGTSLNPNNFASCKQRLLDVIERCRSAGLNVPADEEMVLVANLKWEYEKAVRAAFEREEQARIKTRIREEQLRQKEIDREFKQLDREREAIKAALEKAIADAKDQHSEEVDRLKARLQEAEARSQRAISQAQLTKAGHVYVISNLGSFGDGVFKIGMTRRLEPFDRVRELGSASVPFPFDVHMMISCDDAPTLENALHRTLHKSRINKTNPRKEFFKTDIETIVGVVKENHGEVDYLVDVEAIQYRQSMEMSDEDEEYIAELYDDLEEEDAIAEDN